MKQAAEIITQLRGLVEQQAMEIKVLRGKLDALLRKLYGASSEKIDPAQLLLLLQNDEGTPEDPKANASAHESLKGELAEVEKEEASRKRKDAKRNLRLPPNIETIEVIIDPEVVKENPERYRCIDEEVSEQLDYEPARFWRRRTVRRKYVERGNALAKPIIAPLAGCIRERLTATPRLLAQIAVSRFCDHLPYYRQEQMFERQHGVYIPRQTMCNWMAIVADFMSIVYRQIKVEVFGEGYVEIDETPVPYLAPGNGETKTGYFWTCYNPHPTRCGVFFHWETSRAAECLERLVPKSYKGVLHCDAYSAYEALAKRREGIELCACLAHMRRKWVEAMENGERYAAWILWQMQILYRIERHLRETRAGPDLVEAVRAHQSKPVLERLKKAALLIQAKAKVLPQSKAGKALTYLLENIDGLQAFLEDGRIQIDNNLVENAIRPTAIGKKNWLFIGDALAGTQNAVLYTIVQNCRVQGIDPYTYLCDVLTRLPDMTNKQVASITPRAWKEARAKAAQLPKAA